MEKKRTQSLTQSPNLFDMPGTEAFVSEQHSSVLEITPKLLQTYSLLLAKYQQSVISFLESYLWILLNHRQPLFSLISKCLENNFTESSHVSQ